MAATILDGRSTANQIKSELTETVADFITNNGFVPCLAAVLVGSDPASEVYVKHKRRACEVVGIESRLQRLEENCGEDELLSRIGQLNKDQSVNGILVQLPLPATIRTSRILDAVHPLKDVDAFHPENVGLISQGRPRFLPCTPHGVLQLLFRYEIPVAGKHVVIVGRSDIVGKPLAVMLQARDSSLGPSSVNATVTVCHSRSDNLAEITRLADILIAAVGKPRLITQDMVRPGAVVIDVGINRTDDGLVGDVDFAAVSAIASHITPVPGGVGPLTIAMLLQNTLNAARLQVLR